MNWNDISMAALDLDGTVLTSDKRLTDRTRRAIERAIANEIEVVYITGRPLSGIPQELMDIEGIRYVVTSNGAVTYDLEGNRKLRTRLIDPEDAAAIMQIPEIEELTYSVFVDGMGYCDLKTFAYMKRRYKGTIYEKYVDDSRAGVENMVRFLMESEEGPENIWMNTSDVSLRDALNEMLKDHWKLRTVLTGSTDVEAGHPECDKGLALKDLADYLQMDLGTVLAIGDNDNDRGMLREVGFPVAMGNAPEFVKRTAAKVADTNDNDGVAKILETLRI